MVPWNKGLTKADPRILAYSKKREQTMINKYSNTRPWVIRGRKMSDEAKQKMSDSAKRRWSRERDKIISAQNRGKQSSLKYKESLSRNGLNLNKRFWAKMDKETFKREHLPKMVQGWKNSEKWKAAMSSPEYRRKQGDASKLAHKRLDVREKKSKSMKAAWQNPDSRLRHLQGRLKILKKANRIELMSQESLLKRGIPFLTNVPIDEICEADIVLPDNKIAIFCDGCYWHGCLDCGFNHPKSRQRRGLDKKHNAQLRDRGWKVYRFWEHQIKENPDIVGQTVSRDFGLLVYVKMNNAMGRHDVEFNC